jgi:hypothetical protein
MSGARKAVSTLSIRVTRHQVRDTKTRRRKRTAVSVRGKIPTLSAAADEEWGALKFKFYEV